MTTTTGPTYAAPTPAPDPRMVRVTHHSLYEGSAVGFWMSTNTLAGTALVYFTGESTPRTFPVPAITFLGA